MITSIDQLDFSKRYSYADYLTWKFSERVELIKGFISRMSPSASMKHQMISIALGSIIYNFLEDKECKVFQAPLDVRLLNKKKSTSDKEIFNVVQPDLFIVCDDSIMDDRGCYGSPDVIFEILSIGNSKRDLKEKFDLYEENGVREYWIISPLDQVVSVFDLIDRKYVLRGMFTKEDSIEIKALPQLIVHGEKLFKGL